MFQQGLHLFAGAAEQVTGRQDRILFHVETDSNAAAGLLDALRADLKGMPIRYWLMPLAAAGRLD